VNPELRIGDQERDAAVTALGEHYVAGRLTKDEYDERSAVAWQARTNSDLAPLFSDLPPLQAPQRPVQQRQAPTGHGAHPHGRPGGVPVLPVLVLVLVVALASGLDIWPLLLVLVFFLWIKAAYWRRRAWRHQPRALTRPSTDPWQRGRRP
jgi:uncharacterized protein DUF1707